MQQRRPDFGGVIEDRAGVADAPAMDRMDFEASGFPVQQFLAAHRSSWCPEEHFPPSTGPRMDRAAMGEVIARYHRRGVMIFTTWAGEV